MNDLVERLRGFATGLCPVANPDEQREVDMLREAADEIERLRKIDPKALEAAKHAYNDTLINDALGDEEYVIAKYLAALKEPTDEPG